MLPSQYILEAAKKLLEQHGESASLIAIDQACKITETKDDKVAHKILMQVRNMVESLSKETPESGEYTH